MNAYDAAWQGLILEGMEAPYPVDVDRVWHLPALTPPVRPSTPKRFAYQVLSADSRWSDIHADRIYEERDVPPPATRLYPYTVVSATQESATVFTGIPEVVGERVSRLEVVSVREFAAGGSTLASFDQTYALLLDILTGWNGLAVLDEAGVTQGYVWQSTEIGGGEIDRVRQDGNRQLAEHGVSVRVNWI